MAVPQLSVVTLGIDDLARSKRFYRDGFGWEPVFANDEIAFYQLNGFVFGTWLKNRLSEDTGRPATGAGAVALAHNEPDEAAVDALIGKLVAAGGTVARLADAPAHGGYRGYVADPDGHLWEIAFNPAWTIDAQGRVTFGV